MCVCVCVCVRVCVYVCISHTQADMLRQCRGGTIAHGLYTEKIVLVVNLAEEQRVTRQPSRDGILFYFYFLFFIFYFSLVNMADQYLYHGTMSIRGSGA